MEIETKTASLETFAVTIQALHVSGKQMTLAVFRQLPVAYENDDAQLWGIVRYSIKDEGDIWLVFSSYERLYRRKIKKLYDPGTNSSHLPYLEAQLEEWKEKEPGYFTKKELIDKEIKNLEKQIQETIKEHELDVQIFEYQRDLLLNLPQLFISI